MHNILIEDVTSLALIYSYMADSACRMLSFEKIKAYKKAIDADLDEMNSPVDGVHPVIFSNLIYFNASDENGVWYSILKPDVDIECARAEYIYKMPYEIISASQQDKALDALRLQLVNDRIIKKENNVKKLVNNKQRSARM